MVLILPLKEPSPANLALLVSTAPSVLSLPNPSPAPLVTTVLKELDQFALAAPLVRTLPVKASTALTAATCALLDITAPLMVSLLPPVFALKATTALEVPLLPSANLVPLV